MLAWLYLNFFKSLLPNHSLLKKFQPIVQVVKCAVVHLTNTTWLKKLSGKTLQNLSYILYEYETSKIQLKFFLLFYFLATIVKKLYYLVITVFSLNCNFCLYFVCVKGHNSQLPSKLTDDGQSRYTLGRRDFK